MRSAGETRTGYLLAASIGALVGGTAMLIAGDAIPKIMSRMMSGMMANMMQEMGGEGCNPEEM